MTTMYLIRHAEAEGNLYRIAQGQHDSRITDWGYRQIAALAERFRGEHIDAVYASDLTRTCVTAGAVAATHGLPIPKCSGLRKTTAGPWPYSPTAARCGWRWARWRAAPSARSGPRLTATIPPCPRWNMKTGRSACSTGTTTAIFRH